MNFRFPLVLASTSPRRATLMWEQGWSFQVVPPRTQEIYCRQYSPRELALHNAMLKCRSVARLYPTAIVIGADTVVTLDGTAIGKPRDEEEALRMFTRLAGRTHEVVSGVVVMQGTMGRRASLLEISQVTLRAMAPAAIRAYHARIGPLDKAGAYAAQEDEGEAIAEVRGSFSNVVGLPMERLVELLRSF